MGLYIKITMANYGALNQTNRMTNDYYIRLQYLLFLSSLP